MFNPNFDYIPFETVRGGHAMQAAELHVIWGTVSGAWRPGSRRCHRWRWQWQRRTTSTKTSTTRDARRCWRRMATVSFVRSVTAHTPLWSWLILNDITPTSPSKSSPRNVRRKTTSTNSYLERSASSKWSDIKTSLSFSRSLLLLLLLRHKILMYQLHCCGYYAPARREGGAVSVAFVCPSVRRVHGE